MVFNYNLAAKAFVVGSSLPATIVSLFYIGRAYLGKATHPLEFEYIAVGIPVLFGLFNVAAIMFKGSRKVTRRDMIITGLVFGLFLSTVGTRIFDMPTKIFDFPKDKAYVPMLIAPLLYAVVWGINVYAINAQFGL